VVDVWNKLPEEVVSCNSVNCFRVKLDQIFKEEIAMYIPSFTVFVFLLMALQVCKLND